MKEIEIEISHEEITLEGKRKLSDKWKKCKIEVENIIVDDFDDDIVKEFFKEI
jgi:hypothetical protein